MTKAEATEFAKIISGRYGTAVLFREPSRRESYQAIAGDESGLPPGAVALVTFTRGAAKAEEAA